MTGLSERLDAGGGVARAASDTAGGAEYAGTDSAAGRLPGWFAALLFCAGSVVLSFGTAGLILADAGRFSAVPAFTLGLAGLVPLGLLGYSAGLVSGRVSRQARVFRLGRLGSLGRVASQGRVANLSRLGRLGRSVDLSRLGGAAQVSCLLVTLWSAVNMRHAAHHVAINRDAGAYTVTAKWIAEQGTLQVIPDAAWLRSGVPVRFDSFAMYADASGRLQFQFAHFLPALLAQAETVGGDALLFATPAVLGGLALLAIFATGCLLLGSSWLSLVMTSALAVGLPQLVVSRDTYSETSTQLLLWTGLWLALRWIRDPRWATATLAGLFLGATALTRIDALVYFMALPVAVALLWHARPAPRRTMFASLFGFGGGLAAPVAVGSFDQLRRSTEYYRMLQGQVTALQAATLAGLILGVIIFVFRHIVRSGLIRVEQKLARLGLRLARAGRELAPFGPAAVVLGLVGLWLVRPLVSTTHIGAPNVSVAGLQAAEHQRIDGTRSYGEHSMHWMAWYLGPVCLAAAVLGVGVLVRTALRGGAPAGTALRGSAGGAAGDIRRADAVLLLLVAGLGSLLYLWQPSIVPDQIWASRRFVPATLPFLVLSAGVGIRAGHRWLKQHWRLLAWVVTPILLALAVLAPAANTHPVVQFQAQAGFDAVLRSTCPALGPDAAVVVLPGNRVDDFLTQSLRSWCGVPVARLINAPNAIDLATLSSTWRSAGRRLWVLSGDQQKLRTLASGSDVRLLGSAVSTRELEQAITRLPGRYSPPSYLTVWGRQLG